ncbi:MAG: hypothetical protein Ta2F_18440 [Termitinemataceae bacterium]|nr:MAG: hypothetical protein Ta2F_18440 [Termitinemataceae bacterium]
MKASNKYPKIFTTGAFLSPLKTENADGNEKWVWTVSEFIDDSFLNGEVYNPLVASDSNDELIMKRD